MSAIDFSFRDQQKLEDLVNLKAMLAQLTISLVLIITIFVLFSWLRPRYPSIYSPKEKLSLSDMRRPTTLGPGWFDWIKPVLKTNDDVLLSNIGFDGYIFIYFNRILYKLVAVLTIISMCILLPVNIVATSRTGDWPPAPGLGFMTISSVNYQFGKQSHFSNPQWLWSPTVATWVFSIIIIVHMIYSSEKFLLFRQKYNLKKEDEIQKQIPSMSSTELLQQQKQDLISRTLLVHFRSDCYQLWKSNNDEQEKKNDNQYNIMPRDDVKEWVDKLTGHVSQQVLLGKHNNRTIHLLDEYTRTIKSLEKTLNCYLCNIHGIKKKSPEKNIKDIVASTKRPTIRLGWTFNKIDAINYYTEYALGLNASIQKSKTKLRTNNYGWAIYSTKLQAHEASLLLGKVTTVTGLKTVSGCDNPGYLCEKARLALHPDDIVWSTINSDDHSTRLKRWFGHGLTCSIIFIWAIPITILAVLSNTINLIRFFPRSNQFILDHQIVTGLIESYVAPNLVLLLSFGLPQIFRMTSRHQAYKTETAIEQKILVKLYTFFIINNVFIFTATNIMLGIMGQITSLTLVGTLKNKHLAPYVLQIAKNMTGVSTFWINYVCVRSVGVVFELLQIFPLLPTTVFSKSRYTTPRKLESVSKAPPVFDFAKNYGLVVSLFTVTLAYSATAPIILPFALIYFILAMTAFKYKLMYVYVVKVETQGRIWPLLYAIVMASLVVFQLMMILILGLKVVQIHIYCIIPLPFITTGIAVWYTRYLMKQSISGDWIEANASNNHNPANSDTESSSSSSSTITLSKRTPDSSKKSPLDDIKLINSVYKDPFLFDPLWKPMIYNNACDLIPHIYKGHSQYNRILSTLYHNTKQTTTAQKKANHKSNPIPHFTFSAGTETTLDIEEAIIDNTPLGDEKKQIQQAINREQMLETGRRLQSLPEYINSDSSRNEAPAINPAVLHLSPTLAIIYSTPASLGRYVDETIPCPTAPTLDALSDPEEESTTTRFHYPTSSTTISNSDSFGLSFILEHQQPPPPDYADVVSPRVNMLTQLGPQTQRRHSIS